MPLRAETNFSYLCTLQVLLSWMMLANLLYQTNQRKLILLQRCANFLPDYATESLISGRIAREQRLISHSAREVTCKKVYNNHCLLVKPLFAIHRVAKLRYGARLLAIEVKDLMDRMFNAETSVGVKHVTDTAIAYRLLSKYTAFVAVSQEVRVNPRDRKLRQQVPVLTPEGMLPQKPSASSTAITVPEPSQLLGNLLAIVLLGIFFARKRLKRLNASRGTGKN